METIYKITNSNVRKKFLSLDELKKHVKDKNVLPNDLTNTLKIEKITSENINLDVEISKLSKENAVKELIYFKGVSSHNKNYLKFDSSAIKFLVLKILEDETYKDNVLSKFLYDKIQTMGFTEEYLKSHSNWYGEGGQYEKHSEIFLEFIEHVIENIDTYFDKTEWVKIYTDYKPCNAHGMKIILNGYPIFFLIRNADTLITTYPVFGRNVNSRGVSFLTDNDIKPI
jgi:hypothetical protein